MDMGDEAHRLGQQVVVLLHGDVQDQLRGDPAVVVLLTGLFESRRGLPGREHDAGPTAGAVLQVLTGCQPTACRTRSTILVSLASSCTGAPHAGSTGRSTQLVQPAYSGARVSRTGSTSGHAWTTSTVSRCFG